MLRAWESGDSAKPAINSTTCSINDEYLKGLSLAS